MDRHMCVEIKQLELMKAYLPIPFPSLQLSIHLF